jgi:hypothetical protein
MKTFKEYLLEGSRGIAKYGKAELERDRKSFIAGLSGDGKKILDFCLKHLGWSGHGVGLYIFEFLPYGDGKLDFYEYPGREFKSTIQMSFKPNEMKLAIDFYKKYWREAEQWRMIGVKTKDNFGRKVDDVIIHDHKGNGKGMDS